MFDLSAADAAATGEGLATAGSASPLAARPLSDAGNAEAFRDLFGDGVRYDHKRCRWLVWEGHRWRPDDDGAVYRLALRTARARFHAAPGADDPGTRQALAKHALKSEDAPRLRALLDIARNLEPVADAGDGWDADPWLLGVPNGVVDLRTGELRDGRPEDRITMQAAVPYDPGADQFRWGAFVQEVLDGDAEVASFVQRAAGYSATGSVVEDALFWLYGTGSNGKSTLANAIRDALGDYGHNIPATALLDERRGNHTTDLADLEGKRFVTASELTESARLNEARIKALSGGDPISARHMRQDNRTFEPTAKFWFSTNHLPVVSDDSHGFWRRINVVPFPRTFGLGRDLDAELAAEQEAILAWVIDGARAWHYETLGERPAAVASITEEWRRDEDPLAEFLSALTEDPDAWTPTGDLYRAYCRWFDDTGKDRRDRLSDRTLGKRLARTYTRKRRDSGRNGYVGIRLANEGVPSVPSGTALSP